MDIDLNVLNGFLDEANRCVKDNDGNSPRCKPLCAVEFVDGSEKITFGIEMRGYVRDDEAFFLTAYLDDDEKQKYISRGIFTAHGGHYTSFAMSHDEPRGVNIQQGVLIEMKNLVERISLSCESDFIRSLLDQLNEFKIKIQVVKSELVEIADKDSIGKLEIKGEKKTEDEERKEERIREIVGDEPPEKVPEDTIGEEFAKAVGDKEEKPDKGNSLDMALENMEVYQLKKVTAFGRIVKFFRKLFGLNKDEQALESLFDYEFNEREKNDEKQPKEEKEK